MKQMDEQMSDIKDKFLRLNSPMWLFFKESKMIYSLATVTTIRKARTTLYN